MSSVLALKFVTSIIVIPAKAGIQLIQHFRREEELDARLRGRDVMWELQIHDSRLFSLQFEIFAQGDTAPSASNGRFATLLPRLTELANHHLPSKALYEVCSDVGTVSRQ